MRIGRDGQGRPYERRKHALQVVLGLCQNSFQGFQAVFVQSIQTPAEHLVDQVFLGAKVIVHGRKVDVGRGRDLAQRSASESMSGEQRFGRIQDALLGGEMRNAQEKSLSYVIRETIV